MQSELVEIQRALGITFIYITHSQEEALTMSDRVVLMRGGRIEQVGAPVELFDHPVNRFAAEFMGFENVIPGIVREVKSDGSLIVASGDFLMSGFPSKAAMLQSGARAFVAVRAERLARATSPAGDRMNVVPCTLAKQVYRGKYVDQTADTPIGPMKLRNWDRSVSSESFSAIAWRAEDCVVLSRE